MTKIITIANQKGGVGKTTTAVTLSAALGELGKHILLVDIDPQGNATTGFGVDKNEQENTVYEVIIGDCAVNEAIIKDVVPFVDLMPSNVNLSGAEIELTQFDNREYRLKEQLDYIKGNYDFIFIDCPPSLNTLTMQELLCRNRLWKV